MANGSDGVQVLRCKSLCKSFDGVRALDDVSLTLDGAGIVAIIGPNGARHPDLPRENT